MDLFAVQGTLKSLLQYHSSKVSILWCSAFFIIHLSHLYMTTEKTIALTRWTFVGKVMSLLPNMLSRLIIGGSDGKASACNVGDRGLIPGLGRSPAEGNGNPLQYFCLGNPLNRGDCWVTVHRVTMSQLFALGDQSIRVSASASVLSMNIQD